MLYTNSIVKFIIIKLLNKIQITQIISQINRKHSICEVWFIILWESSIYVFMVCNDCTLSLNAMLFTLKVSLILTIKYLGYSLTIQSTIQPYWRRSLLWYNRIYVLNTLLFSGFVEVTTTFYGYGFFVQRVIVKLQFLFYN